MALLSIIPFIPAAVHHSIRLLCMAVLLCPALLGGVAAQMTSSQKQETLDAHNAARCNEQTRNPTGAPGSNMVALQWDAQLEAVAQAYANTCPSGHNSNRVSQYKAQAGVDLSHCVEPGFPSTCYVGENLAWGTFGTSYADYVTKGWVESEYPADATQPKNGGGHYTQVIWANTHWVGCATPSVNCPSWGQRLYVCNYATAGNFNSQPPYTAGTGTPGACSGARYDGSSSSSSSSKGGAIAAAVLVPLLVIGLAVCYWKRDAVSRTYQKLTAGAPEFEYGWDNHKQTGAGNYVPPRPLGPAVATATSGHAKSGGWTRPAATPAPVAPAARGGGGFGRHAGLPGPGPAGTHNTTTNVSIKDRIAAMQQK